MSDDITLWAAFKKGDRTAFDELVGKHKMRVYNTALALLGNSGDAEEASQDVFVKLFFSRDKFKENSSFTTWLYRITVNKSLDLLRRKKRAPFSLDAPLSEKGDSTWADRVLSGEDVQKEFARKEGNRTLAALLKTLPEKYRLILFLKETEGLSYDAIARNMKISTDQVKVTLFRARKKLREKYLETCGKNK